jgi:hypothetical protein
MKEFRFKTPGGEHVEQVGDGDEQVVFYRTPKGEDLYKILLLVEERAQTTNEARRDEIIREIHSLKQTFEAVWNEDPLALIVEMFGADEEGGEE